MNAKVGEGSYKITMGLAYNVYLNAKKIYGCKNCKTHLADHDEIISRVNEDSTHALSGT